MILVYNILKQIIIKYYYRKICQKVQSLIFDYIQQYISFKRFHAPSVQQFKIVPTRPQPTGTTLSNRLCSLRKTALTLILFLNHSAFMQCIVIDRLHRENTISFMIILQTVKFLKLLQIISELMIFLKYLNIYSYYLNLNGEQSEFILEFIYFFQ